MIRSQARRICAFPLPSLRPATGLSRMAARVLILGAGLSGFATATALATRGFRVTLLEARDRLGGRAASFREAASGQLVDACQHVSMGCCTNFLHFCRTVGVAH